MLEAESWGFGQRSVCAACDPSGELEMTPLEREMAVLRRAEIAAHKFGTAFYPYTEALAVERAARPPIDGFCWSAGWLRPSPAEIGTPLSLEGCDVEVRTEGPLNTRHSSGARTPPSVPTSIVAAVKRQHSPRLAARISGDSLPPGPPPITADRRNDSPLRSAEEGVPRSDIPGATSGIAEGIPPQADLRRSAASAAAVAAAAAAAS